MKKNGFGIIEVIVASGLMAIVSVGIITLLTDIVKTQRGIQAKDLQREIMAEIRTLLNNKTACLNSFIGGDPAASFTRDYIKDSANANRFSKNNNDQSNSLKYIEFKIEGWQSDAGYTTQGLASLMVTLEKQGSVSGVKQIRQGIKLKIKRDAAGNITECFSIGSSSDGFWQISPNNVSNIYYNGGNVGIGTDAPAAMLDVAGSIRPGNAGVSAGAPCGAAEGAIAYDLVAHAPVLCGQAGNWTAVGGGAAVIDCVGSWGACSGTTKTYTVTRPASGAGSTSCPYADGATVACGWNCSCSVRPTDGGANPRFFATNQNGVWCGGSSSNRRNWSCLYQP